MLTDTQIYDRLNGLKWANVFLAAACLLLAIAFSALWIDTRDVAVRSRWIERKFDQGKLIAVDKQTMEEWRRLNEDP